MAANTIAFEEGKAADYEEAEGGGGDVVMELPSDLGAGVPRFHEPKNKNLPHKQLSLVSSQFDRGNKGYLTDAEKGARSMADGDGNIPKGTLVVLVEGNRMLKRWVSGLGALSLVLLAGLVAVGTTLGARIRATGDTTLSRIDESVVARVEPDENGGQHLVGEASGGRLTVRGDGDTFEAVTRIDARDANGRELTCLSIAAAAQMVHDLSAGTRGSLVVRDGETGIERRIVSIDGDFEDRDAYLSFGSFTVAMDGDACSEGVGAELREEDVPEGGEGEDGFLGRRMRSLGSSVAVADGAPNEGSAALTKNRRAYAAAHAAVKAGRGSRVLDETSENLVEVTLGALPHADRPIKCTTPEDGCEAFWFHELDLTVQQCEELFGYSKEEWNTGAEDTYEYNSWTSMTPRQQACAEYYGWDEASWDAALAEPNDRALEESTDDAIEICSDFVGQDKCEGFWWHELAIDIKGCLEKLYVTEAIWDYSGHNDPTLFVYWSDLNDEQKACAESFGYNGISWDGTV